LGGEHEETAYGTVKRNCPWDSEKKQVHFSRLSMYLLYIRPSAFILYLMVNGKKLVKEES